jgi:hypothetical protein
MKRSTPEPGRPAALGAYLDASRTNNAANATLGNTTAATGTRQPLLRTTAASMPGMATAGPMGMPQPPGVMQAPVFRPGSLGNAAPAPFPVPIPGAAGNGPARPGSAPQAAMPAAPAPGIPGQPGCESDVWQDQALLEQAGQAVLLGMQTWSMSCSRLEKEGRARFLIASLPVIAKLKGRDYLRWKSVLQLAFKKVEITRLIAQQWPDEVNLVHLLVRLQVNQLLDRVLATEAGKACLFKANKQGLSPLHTAVLQGNKEAIGKILACDDTAGSLRMAPNAKGNLPIHFAATMGDEDCAELLLSCKGKEQRMFASSVGQIPLSLALLYGGGQEELVTRLLAECRQEQTSWQSTDSKANCLMYAAAVGMVSAVQALLAVESTLAQQLALRDVKGRSAWDIAKQGGHADILALLDSAMQGLPATSSATTSTASTATTSSQPGPHGGNQGPVPMTPFPPSPQAGEAFESFTDEDGPF